jgi:hypothetical protein
MGMRGRYLDFEYVRALNLVQVEFAAYPKILAALTQFLNHVETPITGDPWFTLYRDLKTDLLLEIGKVVGFSSSAFDVGRRAYFPEAWSLAQKRRDGAEQFLVDLGTGDRAVPVFIIPPASLTASPATDPTGGTNGGAPTA